TPCASSAPTGSPGPEEESAGRKRNDREMEPSLFRFLSILGHELRNPLAAISNALHLIGRRNAGDPALERSCELIGRQGRHRARLPAHSRAPPRTADGRRATNKARWDPPEPARAAPDAPRGAAEAPQPPPRLERPQAPVWVEGDPARLAQVVTHLLNNAVKF